MLRNRREGALIGPSEARLLKVVWHEDVELPRDVKAQLLDMGVNEQELLNHPIGELVEDAYFWDQRHRKGMIVLSFEDGEDVILIGGIGIYFDGCPELQSKGKCTGFAKSIVNRKRTNSGEG